MNFTALPEAFASIGGGLFYTLSDCTEAEVRLIVRNDDGQCLGSKRFVRSPTCTLDIAQMLRSLKRCAPEAGCTGFFEATNRSITVQVEAETEQQTLISERRTFLYTSHPAEQPSLLRSLPREGILAPDEWEELTLLTQEPLTVTVTAYRQGRSKQTAYTADEGGLQLFRIAAADFPEAERLEVDLGPCGMIRYTCSSHPESGIRLAWLSSAGSIEHYTFPRIEKLTQLIEKEQCRTAEGIQTFASSVKEHLSLRSYFADRHTARALGELLYTVQAWSLIDGIYHPIEVLTREATLHRYGTATQAAIEICTTHPDHSPWN